MASGSAFPAAAFSAATATPCSSSHVEVEAVVAVLRLALSCTADGASVGWRDAETIVSPRALGAKIAALAFSKADFFLSMSICSARHTGQPDGQNKTATFFFVRTASDPDAIEGPMLSSRSDRHDKNGRAAGRLRDSCERERSETSPRRQLREKVSRVLARFSAPHCTSPQVFPNTIPTFSSPVSSAGPGCRGDGGGGVTTVLWGRGGVWAHRISISTHSVSLRPNVTKCDGRTRGGGCCPVPLQEGDSYARERAETCENAVRVM